MKLRMKLSSLSTCTLFYTTIKQDQRTEDPFCFSMLRDVKIRIFAEKFSLDNGKNLASLKYLQKLIPM